MITIKNWNLYQAINQQNNQQNNQAITKHQPSDNQAITTEEEIIDIEEIKEIKKTDIFCDDRIKRIFSIYSEKCNNLCKLTFEKRNKQILDKVGEFLQEINYDFNYFNNLCSKANELKEIANNKIDFKSMLNNHIGIMNDKYIKENNIKRGVSKETIKSLFAQKGQENE